MVVPPVDHCVGSFVRRIPAASECGGNCYYIGCQCIDLACVFNTYYVVTADGMLLLRCGFFPKKEIAIADIEALQPSILPVFSYSLSLDRIVIWKEGKMWMLISPQNEKEFVKLLKKFNPDIEIRRNEGIQI